MNTKELEILQKIKENIKLLISNNQLEDANISINEYKKNVPNDIEIYSMEAIIAIIEGELEKAESIINDGLDIDDENFDLLYNLAYVFQLKNENEKAVKIYENLLKEYSNLEIVEQIQNNIIILKKNLDFNENIFLNLQEYEYDFVSSINKVNRNLVFNYIEYLINKYPNLKDLFTNIILNKFDIKNKFIYIEFCKALLNFDYKEEIYRIYNQIVIDYVKEIYKCENLDKLYVYMEDKNEKNKMVVYLLNEAIKNKKYDIANVLLTNLINLSFYEGLKYATKEFFIRKVEVLA